MKFLAIALGGAAGSVLRCWMSTSIQHRFASNFPIGTLSVNALGSLLIGLVFVLAQHRLHGNEIFRGLVMIGLLGGFTTFSTFSLETLQLLQTGFWSKALLNIISSVLVCILCAFSGMQFGRWVVNI